MSHQALSLLAALGALVALLPAHAAPRADFHVSLKGRDEWSGALSAPNNSRTDGPFRTISRAQQAVRSLIARQGAARRPITVEVGAGIHALAETITLGPADSGAQDAPVTWAAAPGTQPVLSGGVRLKGFTVGADRRWRLTIPEVARGEWYFQQLFVNGVRRSRPRLPRAGYHAVAVGGSSSPSAAGRGYDRFGFAPGDIRADWRNREDVDLLCFQIWTMARMKIRDVDEAALTVSLAEPTLGTIGFFALPQGARYIAENVAEALGAPGEWYLDRRTGELTYVPMPGETPGRAEVIAPRLPMIMRLAGETEERRWVQDVVFRGLSFEHSNWLTPAGGNQSPQAEVNIPGAIVAEGARRCVFDRCAVRRIGHYGIDLGRACQDCRIVGCEITDMGGGGVRLGEPGSRPEGDDLACRNTVEECLIAHGGRMHPASIGVWIGASPHNIIRHNEIADLYYTAISVGWSWGYEPTGSHHNTLEYNHLHDIGQYVLSDMGGTYTLGLAPGSVQRFNRIHDVASNGYGGWGIYFDEGTTGMLAENNLVYRTKSAPFHQHYGRENVVRNNIWAFGREAQLMRSRAEAHLSFTFEHNIVLWSDGPLLGSNWSGSRANYRLDDNLYWQARGERITFAGSSLADWRAAGQDARSVIADPGFAGPDRGDFRLKPGSPALGVGFVPFDISGAGRTGVRSLSGLGGVPPAFPIPLPAAPPRTGAVNDGFETTVVGGVARGAVTSEENATATVRVTEEAAASGVRSLKFTDSAGQSQPYNPHLYYQPGFDRGRVQASFALRVERGAVVSHEWRDAGSPYAVGPSIHVGPDGELTAAGRQIAMLPAGQWVRLTISCPLGAKADGKWDLTLAMPGRAAPIRAEGLPCSGSFRTLAWFGFVSDTVGASVFYIDDVKVGPVRSR